MPGYRAPVDEVLFLLGDVLHVERHSNLAGFSEAGADVVAAVLREAARLSEGVLAPLNRVGDLQGCRRHPDGTVTTPDGFKEAHRAYAAGGWIGLSVPARYGGQGLPYLLNAVVNEFASSANMAFAMYPGLTMGAIAALLAHGSEKMKQLYVPPMIEGRWSGTMNLTEPQCGTDLGLIRTRAVPRGDGSHAITGTKIFISSGEHDLTENVIHLVLARIEGAPSGTRGISLFVVPKIVPGADGALGERNGLSCGSLEHKMGIHANATCVMNYDAAQGWLIGEENRGLPAMFVMMNEARLAVGIQGLAQSENAYQHAAAYAKERLQGRALSGTAHPDKPADPILVHADVRRMLMRIRAVNEAGRALVLQTALNSDIAHRSEEAAERQAAEDRLGLMTPVVKGVLTDLGFDNAVQAQQVLGGHGYIAAWGLEQIVRDSRIAMIYEGANGIQAMDLVGRKLPRDGGRGVAAFFEEVAAFCRAHAGEPALAAFVPPLEAALAHLQQATLWFLGNAIGRPDHAGAGATDYMHLMGLVAMGHMWGRIAEAALARRAADPAAAERMEAKLVTGRFFMERVLPETALRLARITAGADVVMALPAEMF